MMSPYAIDWSELSLQVLITFAHFLWQACVVGLVLFAVQHAVETLRRQFHSRIRGMGIPVGRGELEPPPATIHYAISCLAFFSPPVIVVATFAGVHQSRGLIVAAVTVSTKSSAYPIAPEAGAMTTMADFDTPVLTPSASKLNAELLVAEPIEPPGHAVLEPSFSTQIQSFSPYILFAYVVGVAFMLTRLCLSIVGSSPLRRTIQPITDALFLKVIAEQATCLGLKRIPVVRICQRVSVPVVVGILKPMILLPPTLLCGMDPQQIAAVLSHEMAHIRRYDLIFNLMQRIVEALLFFHPVTWWISRRVSLEREKCCDDVVVACMGRLPYASALLQMAELCIGSEPRRSATQATLSASGSNTTDFGYRIRRLISAEETTRVGLTRRSFSIGLALVSLAAVSVAALAGSNPFTSFGSGSSLATSDLVPMSNESSDPKVIQAAPDSVQTETQNAGKVDETGSVKGRITLDGTIPTLPKLRVPTPTGPRLDIRATEEKRKVYEASLVEIDDESLKFNADGGLANAIVFLAKAPAKWQPIKADLQPITITMQDYRFEPRVAIIRTGQDVRLDNSGVGADNFRFEPLSNGPQNRLVKAGDEITLKQPFTSPEKKPIQAKSNINSWKLNFLLPLDHPFAALTDKQGRFSIEGLPPGTHSFLIWHERTGWLEKSLAVIIQANKTTEVSRSYGLDRFKLAVNQNKLLTEPTDVLWGEPVDGMRLGIRQSELARRRSTLRHGEHIDYEVWIKNETDEVVRIARDSRDLHHPRLMDNRSINVIGGGTWLSFHIPAEELAKAELVLPPGQAARRFLAQSHTASIRPPGSSRGRYGLDPLLVEPGKYTVYAQVGDLKSGVAEVEILPAARLQVRKSSQVTDKKRENASADPSEAILTWQTGDGEKQEAMVNWDHCVMVDERDLTSVNVVPVDGKPDQYAISLQLRPDSAKWLSDRIRSYSQWDDPDMVAILLDGKPLGAIHIPSPIPNGKLIVSAGLSLKQAEAIVKEIQSAITVQPAQVSATVPPSTAPTSPTASQSEGVKLQGEIEMPSDEWLFRRQVKQLPDMTPRERPRDCKGDTIDPEDGRLVHELTRKDVLAVSVTVKANDGRDYSKTVQTDKEGKFRFGEAIPVGSYQIDANAVLTRDDDSQAVLGEPAADLRAGTQLLRVEQGEEGEKTLEFELYPVPFNGRLCHADPAKRTAIIGKLTENNQPVPNARVVLYGGIATRWKIAESMTDQRGQYRFENVRGELIGVQVKHEKLVPADGLNWRDINSPKFGTSHRLDLQMTAGGFITGQLLDENKQPRAKVNVRMLFTEPGDRTHSTKFIAYVTTDAAGNFTSEPLYPGNYLIEENVGQYPVLGEVEVRANQTTKL